MSEYSSQQQRAVRSPDDAFAILHAKFKFRSPFSIGDSSTESEYIESNDIAIPYATVSELKELPAAKFLAHTFLNRQPLSSCINKLVELFHTYSDPEECALTSALQEYKDSYIRHLAAQVTCMAIGQSSSELTYALKYASLDEQGTVSNLVFEALRRSAIVTPNSLAVAEQCLELFPFGSSVPPIFAYISSCAPQANHLLPLCLDKLSKIDFSTDNVDLNTFEYQKYFDTIFRSLEKQDREECLLACLASGDVYKRQIALTAMCTGEIQIPKAVRHFRELLNHDSFEIVSATALAVAVQDNETCHALFRDLLSLLKTDCDKVVGAALCALGRCYEHGSSLKAVFLKEAHRSKTFTDIEFTGDHWDRVQEVEGTRLRLAGYLAGLAALHAYHAWPLVLITDACEYENNKVQLFAYTAMQHCPDFTAARPLLESGLMKFAQYSSVVNTVLSFGVQGEELIDSIIVRLGGRIKCSTSDSEINELQLKRRTLVALRTLGMQGDPIE